MRLSLALGLALLGAHAAAMSPDGDGYVVVGGQVGTAFPSQRAYFPSFGSDQFVGISSYGLEGIWTQPLAERLSLRALAVMGGDENEVRIHGDKSPWVGDATDRTQGNYYVLGGGLRFFSAAGFDPWIDQNPDGKPGWPVLQVLFQQLERSEVEKTVSATGAFAGSYGKSSVDLETQQLDYSLELPLDRYVTLGLDYHKEVKVRTYYRSDIFVSDYGSTGDHEGVGGGLDFHFRFWDPASEASRPPYLPHVGLPGQGRLSVHYLQSYDLRWQKLSYRAYNLEGTYVLAQGLGLSVGWQAVDYGSGGPLKSGNGITVTQDDPWGQSWNASISYGWGKVQRPESQNDGPK